MKLVFDPRNSVEAHVVSHLLEQAGIPTSISGDYLSGARGEMLAEDQTRVWVIHDEDEQQARALIAEWNNSERDNNERTE